MSRLVYHFQSGILYHFDWYKVVYHEKSGIYVNYEMVYKNSANNA